MSVTDDDDPRVLLLMKLGGGHAVVSPAKACDLLDCGLSRIYKLMDAGELPSILLGGRRKIGIEHIAKLLARKEAEGRRRTMPWDKDGLAQRQYHPRREDAPDSDTRQQARAEAVEVRRGPGRPRKSELTQPRAQGRRKSCPHKPTGFLAMRQHQGDDGAT